MVNWREDIEFIYVLSMLVSSIIVFFELYNLYGLQLAAEVVVGAVLLEVLVGAFAFESPYAIHRWEKLEKNQPAQ